MNWAFENKRNIDNADLFEAIICEAYGDVKKVAAGHHLFFKRAGSPDPVEIPSADALIFDHFIAQKIWGDRWRDILTRLALAPVDERDALLLALYHTRKT